MIKAPIRAADLLNVPTPLRDWKVETVLRKTYPADRVNPAGEMERFCRFGHWKPLHMFRRNDKDYRHRECADCYAPIRHEQYRKSGT